MKKSTQFHHLMVIEPNEPIYCKLMVIEPNEPIYCKLNKDKTGLKEVVTDFVVNDE